MILKNAAVCTTTQQQERATQGPERPASTVYRQTRPSPRRWIDSAARSRLPQPTDITRQWMRKGSLGNYAFGLSRFVGRRSCADRTHFLFRGRTPLRPGSGPRLDLLSRGWRLSRNSQASPVWPGQRRGENRRSMPSSSRRSIAHRPQFAVAKNCDGGAEFSAICSRRVGGWLCHALGPHVGNSADAKEVIITDVSPNRMPDKSSCISEMCENWRFRNTCFAFCVL